MKTFQQRLCNAEAITKLSIPFTPDLLLLFISPQYPYTTETLASLAKQFPTAILTGCSTAGEILDTEVQDASVALTAVAFEKTRLQYEVTTIDDSSQSEAVGARLVASLMASPDLRHVLVFSEGLNVNGADLVKGITTTLPESVSVTGGLAGDGPDFNTTFIVNNGKAESNKVAVVGLYGEQLKIGFGSQGGWDSFGVERLVTRSEHNVLYELDGKPALALYKSFLGDKAAELPGSGLLFPLSMRDENSDKPLVRTILAIDEEAQSLTFAGNIPTGAYVRLMKANVDRLISGAENSAEITQSILDEDAQLAILISCVGRRLVLKQLVEEEVEAVREVLGPKTAITGFYSYGEIAPFEKFQPCQLHNQTMTITTFTE